MPRTAKIAKSGVVQIRNRNCRIRNQISPIILVVKDLLPAKKAAETLASWLDEPLGTCQKLLCGVRAPNAIILEKLLRDERLGKAVLFAIGAAHEVTWIGEVQSVDRLNDMEREARAALKRVERQRRAQLEPTR
jgi:hypothetical protein